METTIQQTIDELSPWFHNIHLPDGTQTAPDHFLGDFPAFKWKQIAPAIPENLEGKTVLDIGCNAGFYSLELARRGAKVTAIDLDTDYLQQADWVLKQHGLRDRVTLHQLQVYDLAGSTTSFDIVWFMGVFYHLRYPTLAMDILAEKTREMMVFQTLTMPGDGEYNYQEDYNINDRESMLQPGWPKMAFIEGKLNQDPTNWWAPNSQGVKAVLRSAGMEIVSEPSHETYICRPDPNNPSPARTWNRSEYLSAIGQDWREEVSKKTG